MECNLVVALFPPDRRPIYTHFYFGIRHAPHGPPHQQPWVPEKTAFCPLTSTMSLATFHTVPLTPQAPGMTSARGMSAEENCLHPHTKRCSSPTTHAITEPRMQHRQNRRARSKALIKATGDIATRRTGSAYPALRKAMPPLTDLLCV